MYVCVCVVAAVLVEQSKRKQKGIRFEPTKNKVKTRAKQRAINTTHTFRTEDRDVPVVAGRRSTRHVYKAACCAFVME